MSRIRFVQSNGTEVYLGTHQIQEISQKRGNLPLIEYTKFPSKTLYTIEVDESLTDLVARIDAFEAAEYNRYIEDPVVDEPLPSIDSLLQDILGSEVFKEYVATVLVKPVG